jgi:PsbP-like protein
VILSVWLAVYSISVISIWSAAQLQQAKAENTITPTKTTYGNTFLTYENNSTLGIKLQYPANWERDSYDDKVAFFAPSLGNSEIIPASMFVEVDNLPFQITDVEDYISHYVNHLTRHAAISEPSVVTLTRLAGNLAYNFTASAKIGQDEYRATDIIMLSGVKKYEMTYYIAKQSKLSSYLPTIQKMIDSLEINIGITNSSKNEPTSGNFFLTYENNSTLGIKIQYPANWQRIESENNVHGVLFLSPSESNSDKFLESFSVSSSSLSNSNNNSVEELARQAISDHIEHLPDFQLLDIKLITVKDNPAYMLVYKYTDLVFGKAMAMDIGMENGDKVYILSYLAEPSKFFRYLPTIQKMVDSFEIQNIVNRFVERSVAPAISPCSDYLESLINLDCLSIMFQR